jgi:hypothetical protein
MCSGSRTAGLDMAAEIRRKRPAGESRARDLCCMNIQ